jgi:hypothetical protein
MNPHPPRAARAPARLRDPKYAPRLVLAIMAIAMSLVMSLVETIIRRGLAPNLLSAWLSLFALGVVVAVPTAVLLAPGAQRLVRHFTARRRRSPIAGRFPAAEVAVMGELGLAMRRALPGWRRRPSGAAPALIPSRSTPERRRPIRSRPATAGHRDRRKARLGHHHPPRPCPLTDRDEATAGKPNSKATGEQR